MVKGLILTPRDIALLKDTYDSVALSLAQIHARHFPDAQMPTVCNRLTKLRAAGFLEKTKVGFVLYRGSPREIGTVYQVSKRGIQALQGLFPGQAFRDQAPRVHFATLAHDLLLSDVLWHLRKQFPANTVTHGKLLGTPWRSQERQPDAVMEASDPSTRVAIELELTAKSEQRYRQIVLQYQMSQTYPSVLYVLGSKEAGSKLKEQLGPDHGKFQFTSLEELTKEIA